MTDHELKLFERYLERFDKQLELFETYGRFLNQDNHVKELRDRTVKMLRGKIDELYKATSEKDVKKVIRLKKVLERESRNFV